MKNLFFLLIIGVLFLPKTLTAQESPVEKPVYKPLPLPNPSENEFGLLPPEALYLVTRSADNPEGDSVKVQSPTGQSGRKSDFIQGQVPKGVVPGTEVLDSLGQLPDKVFTDLQPADLFSGFPNYPFSAIVKINTAMKDNLGNVVGYGTCSGVMIGPRHLLTAGHCISNPSDNVTLDFGPYSFIRPAYNMGSAPYGSALITSWSSFNGWTENGSYDYDIALLEVDWNIGQNTGWFGYGYNQNDSWFTDPTNVHSSIGYPASNDAGNPVLENGERMYAMQGYLDYFSSTNTTCHYNIGFKGQSGSGLYYREGNDRYVLGVLSHGNGTTPPYYTCHTRMNATMFNTFKDIINGPSTSTSAEVDRGSLRIYPNPVQEEAAVLFPTTLAGRQGRLQIWNLQGQLVHTQEMQATIEPVRLALSTFSSGMYLLQFNTDDSVVTGKIMKL